jgi:hypothetical protein
MGEPRYMPGQSGNLRGRPVLPDDLKAVSEISPTKLKLLLSHYLSISITDLKEIAEDPQLSGIEALLIGVIIKAIVNGDSLRADFLLNRLVGRVKEIEQKDPHDGETEALKLIPREQLLLLVRSNRKKLNTPKE